MEIKSMREGLIYTNDNCVGCNKCIGACSCPGATIATENSEGKNVIKIDSSKCIACGACFDICEHNAREYKDDTLAFFDDLKNGEDISVLIAPAFVANYPKEYREILGKLKALGVKRILSVAFGADITTWAYINYVHKYDFKGGISQPCPATVDYIEKYVPELIPKLIPIQSPMMCAAIYARNELNISDKFAFIGPCIAKKNEIESQRGQGIISYNVTFDHMVKYLRNENIEADEADFEMEAGLGSVYPMPGGLAENILWFLGEDAFVRQISGEKHMYHYLEENKDRILSNEADYYMLDVLNCAEGCLCGTGVENELINHEDIFVQMHRIKEKSKKNNSWAIGLSPEERLEGLNKHFEKLNLEDYICSYTDKSGECQRKKPTEEELDVIFDEMNKLTTESREINCSCCGYNSCKEMAEAIYNGFNHKENCIHFLKNILEDIDAECPTVLLIREKTKSVHLVKYTGEDAIRSWINSGLGLLDYNEAISDYIHRYVDEADQERVWEAVEFSALERNISKDNHFSIYYTRHPEKGASGYFQLEFTRMVEQNNIVLTFRDVDSFVRGEQEKEKQLKDALVAAEQANRTKSTFLANMSHEIRTPINAILGMDTMILRESNQESILEYARNVKSASETLLSLINDILDFSKIESGKMEIVEGDYRLDSVINDLVNMIKGKVEEKGLAFKINIMPNLPVQLHGDEVRIKQVILNILNNAVKYTKTGSIEFNIGYDQQDDNTINLLVAVKDTGIGIKKEDMDSLFSPYQRLEENVNKHIEGTGLGLSITRDLLSKMNSELKVDSVYGEGSTFSFSLRQSMWGADRLENNQFKASETAYKEEKKEMFHAKNAKILVVDDVEMNLIVIKGLLKRVQIVPECCLSGQEAIELTRVNKYDIIFLDAMMPGLSGEETLVKIRELCSINADTPIIVLTANAVVGAREHYIEQGFVNYLSKPINGEKFEKMIGQYLPEDKIEWIESDVVKEDSNKESGDNSKINENVDGVNNDNIITPNVSEDDSNEELSAEDNHKKNVGIKHFSERSIRGGVASVLAVLTIICTILILFQVVSVKSFNSKAVVTDSTLNDSPVYLVSNGVTEDTDTWNTVLQQSKAPEDLKNYIGATCNILVDNNQAFKINNWNLRLNVREELYINGFWCGKFEMHQFRNGVEIVEIVDSGNYVINTSALDHNVYIPQMMIRMLPGDYMVYIPSAENKELEIGPNQSVGIGLIAYFEENLDLSDLELTYFNKKRFVDGALFDIIAILGVLWILLAVIYVAIIVTYKLTKQEMETLIHTVLDGLSREYMTLWMVDVQSKKIQLIRGVELEEVQEVVKKAKKFEDYDVAIKYYVDHYVDLKDRETVWNAVKFDAIAERIKKEDFFTINYVQHTFGQQPCYFQMAFSMTRNAKGEENIVLAYRNMDAVVKEEQKQKQQLADAFAKAQEANQAKMLFFANMSHEIRTPINAIMGMNTMIMRETGEEKTREYADEIKKSSETLISLVDDILNVAKSETTSMEQKTTENLLDVVDDKQIVVSECYHAPDAKLLVVDDVEMNLVVIKNLLKRLKIEPQTCLSGKEAVELARKQKFDIIFLDAMMPELSGEETFKMIREECEVNRETPIIVVTANAIVGAKEQYLSVGFNDYISKPIDDKVFETIIQQYLPKDKVLSVDSCSNDEQLDNSTAEMSIINEIARIDGIVVEEGVKASGGAETYINVCANYYETAKSRMDMIRWYFGEKDFDNYAIQTHALKSSSRLIGALELSELALKMELAGKAKDYESMEECTEKLLSQYDTIRIGLKGVFDKARENLEDTPKKELSPKKFRKKIVELKELIEAFDYETAKMLFDSLKEYQLPEDFMETYSQLKISMAEVNSDAIRSALEQYLDKGVV